MGNIWIKEFTGGLDTRRLPETTAGGVLVKANNGHITRGGEFEKRAAFPATYALPVGATKGLAAVATGLVVFGNLAAPSMPSGVAYQRLQHPDGVTPLNRILSTDNYAGKIYAAAEFEDGSIFHFYDGTRVTNWFDGRARFSFDVTGGTGASSITGLTVDGVAVISGSVTWATSNEATATAIAAAINSFTSTPDYVATAAGNQVNVIAAAAGAAANARPVATTVASGLILSPTSGALAGGTDLAANFEPGGFVKTYGSRMLSVSGPLTHGSGIDAPTQWTTDVVGAFFIDMSRQAAGLETLKALAEYQVYIAIFAERTTIIWYIDPDPTLNKKAQVLNNTGTASPRSVTKFGDNDLFYLDESGIRSLRARDASNSAATTDIGVPIDTIVTAKLQTLTETERDTVIGLIEPRGGRFWMIVKDVIYVFSYFPGAKVSAWTTYEPGFDITDAALYNRRAYVRSGDTIYAYGGLGDDLAYDGVEAEAWIAYQDGGAPALVKNLNGVDAACRGEWEISLAFSLDDQTAADVIGRIARSTFNNHKIPASGSATHVAVRMRTTGSTEATVGSVVIHYDSDADEDK